MRYLKYVLVCLLAALVAACGGGGNPGGTSSGGGATNTDPLMSLSLVDASGSTLSANAISKSATYYAKVLITSSTGTGLANQLVTFSTDYTVATLAGNAAQATALTDSSGVAKVLISPFSLTTNGAAVLTASASVNTTGLTKSINFGTSASNVTLGGMSTSPATIGALETSAISVVGSVNGVASAGVVVTFTATCGSFSPASATTNSSGVASSTYQSVAGCGSSTVTLTASAVGATDVVKTIAVTAAKAANIVFTSATPTLMYVSSAASGAKTSVVKFQVLDSSSTGMASQSVSMSLSTAAIAAGVKFSLSGSTSVANQTVTTDSSGFASITVASGTLPTTVSVSAALVSDPTVVASSLGLVVTTGAATQNAASLSATKLSIEAWNTDGVTSVLNMRVADRMGNPVPNGTNVNFVTAAGLSLAGGAASGGLITGSCTTTNSACSVTYTSQGTRPANGRIAILAYLDGEESFIDLNGDNVWQSGETFYDVGKAYIDVNENGSWASGEQIIDTSTNALACVDSTNSYPAIVGTCDGTWSSAIRVRKQAVITLAQSTAVIAGVTGTEDSFTLGATRIASGFSVWIHDTNTHANDNGNVPLFNAMPTGTTVTASINTTGAACTVVSVSPNVVDNSTNGGFHRIVLSGAADCATVQVNVSATTPAGVTTTQPF